MPWFGSPLRVLTQLVVSGSTTTANLTPTDPGARGGLHDNPALGGRSQVYQIPRGRVLWGPLDVAGGRGSSQSLRRILLHRFHKEARVLPECTGKAPAVATAHHGPKHPHAIENFSLTMCFRSRFHRCFVFQFVGRRNRVLSTPEGAPVSFLGPSSRISHL